MHFTARSLCSDAEGTIHVCMCGDRDVCLPKMDVRSKKWKRAAGQGCFSCSYLVKIESCRYNSLCCGYCYTCTSVTLCYPILSSSLTASLILWQLLIHRRTTDRINLQIKCLWLVLIYRSGQKWAVCVHECACQWGCVLMACIKKSNNLTDGEGLVRSRLCDGEQSLRLDCSRSTRQTWQGEGYQYMRVGCVCVKWEEGVV